MTRCWTQAGELAAAGWMTWDGRPAAIPGWACSSPSSSHSRPKPIRSTRCAAGSAGRRAVPWPSGFCRSRTLTQTTDSTAKIARAMIAWCSRADRNAATTVGSSTFRPLFMPGMASADLHDSRRDLGPRPVTGFWCGPAYNYER